MALASVHENVTGHLPAPTAVFLFFALLLLFCRYILTSHQLNKLPLIGSNLGNALKREKYYHDNANTLYDYGYRFFKNTVHRITTLDGDCVVVPNHFLDQLRHRSDAEVDNIAALSTLTESRYTGLIPPRKQNALLNHLVRGDLTRNLTHITPALSAEVEKTVAEVLPQSTEWTRINPRDVIQRIVAIVSGRIFIGPELCRAEEYLHASIYYATDIGLAVQGLKAWSWWLRPVGKYFVPALRKVWEHRRQATEFLRPVVEERKRRVREGEEVPDDVLQWMIRNGVEEGIEDAETLAYLQLTLSMAAIDTTSNMVTNVFYDLVTMPEVVEEMRKEISSVLEDTNGVITAQALFRMKLVDSVMRESQRLNPPGLVAFKRQVLKPIALPDGTIIPAGANIETPSDPILRDPALYPDPARFDPYRFYDLRASRKPDPIGYKNREQYQFVSVNQENMSFGFGRHACPGRFFAAQEIKMVLAQILLKYDIGMPEGVTERYGAVKVGAFQLPDWGKEILIRKAVV